jgi:hypothetical protein
MTLLMEVVKNKYILDDKIEELIELLLNTKNETEADALAKELVSLLDSRQHVLVNIHKANVSSKINIGGVEADIAIAVILRDTLKKKIDCLSLLIKDVNNSLDKLKLMEQRDKYYEDLKAVSMAISKNDLNVDIG